MSYKTLSQIDCDGFDFATDESRYFVDSSSGSCGYYPTLESARAKVRQEVEEGHMARVITETLHYVKRVEYIKNGHFYLTYYRIACGKVVSNE